MPKKPTPPSEVISENTVNQAIANPKPELAGGVSRMEAWATALKITTAEHYKLAIEKLQGIKRVRAEIKKSFEDSKTKARDAWQAIVSHEKSFLDKCDEAERIAKEKILSYKNEQDRIAEDERRRKQAALDEEARKQREAIEAKARRARSAESKEALREQAASITAPVVAAEQSVPQVDGATSRKTFVAEIEDVKAFLDWVFANKRYDLVTPNLKTIDAYAKAMREKAEMPGVKFSPKETLAIGV